MVTYNTETVCSTMVLGLMSDHHSTRGCEALTANMASDVRKALSIPGRIADNTLGNAVARLDVDSVNRALVRMVKAEHRRGNLKPDELGIGAVAIDGKNVATLHYKDLLRLCKVEDGPDAADQIAAVLKANYPYVQLHRSDDGKVYAVIRQHNVALISSKAAVTVLTRPIEANTNEIGALPALLDRLHRAPCFSLLLINHGLQDFRGIVPCVSAPLPSCRCSWCRQIGCSDQGRVSRSPLVG